MQVISFGITYCLHLTIQLTIPQRSVKTLYITSIIWFGWFINFGQLHTISFYAAEQCGHFIATLELQQLLIFDTVFDTMNKRFKWGNGTLA